MKYYPFILSVATGVTAFVGDLVVFQSPYSDSKLFKAAADNLVHAVVGLLSALTFFGHDRSHTANHSAINNIIMCTLAASLIDVDHVFIAKSLHIKDLTNLKQRGVLHCTTAWFFVAILIFTFDHFMKNDYQLLAVMMLLASTSHHIRDANRRGLWLYPFGHTPPLTRTVYLAMLCLLPNIFYYLYIYYVRVSQKYVPVAYYIDV